MPPTASVSFQGLGWNEELRETNFRREILPEPAFALKIMCNVCAKVSIGREREDGLNMALQVIVLAERGGSAENDLEISARCDLISAPGFFDAGREKTALRIFIAQVGLDVVRVVLRQSIELAQTRNGKRTIAVAVDRGIGNDVFRS